MTFHTVCNTQPLLNENIRQSFKSESAPCIKLLFLKRKSQSEKLKQVVFIMNPKLFHIDSNMKH